MWVLLWAGFAITNYPTLDACRSAAESIPKYYGIKDPLCVPFPQNGQVVAGGDRR